MKTLTTIRDVFAGNRIFVPTYQRAFSWDTEIEKSNLPKQVNQFLLDLENFNKSSTKSQYYFGHFLFEDKENKKFAIIDGQQRMSIIIIFLSALFSRLEEIRFLKEDEQEIYEDIIKRNSTYRFETVDYDDRFFKDCVIDKTKQDRNGLKTVSAKRIATAFDFFVTHLKNKDEEYLRKMLNTIENTSCTTHPIKDESEAIQMFIFQNNRGKKPSNLEIIKAQFMFNIHLYAGEDKESLIKEIKDRFEEIYKSISSIEYKINEDDILIYTLRIHFNSLWEVNAIDRINKLLAEKKSISFIKSFTNSLAVSFEHLRDFFGKDKINNFEIHSLITAGGIGIVIPFIIKAYIFGLEQNQINLLCSKLESIVIRHRLIGTRADITSRLNDVYQNFDYDNPDIQPIVDRINWMKITDNWWWAYWNNKELESSIQGNIRPTTAKYLLWKYEVYLEKKGKQGYVPIRFDKIENPELEHIAPVTAQKENPQAGYDNYDEDFINKYINCLGNYLLLSKSHNCSIGNKPFVKKRNSYTHLEQQREIQEMTIESPNWTKDLILERKNKIIKFIIDNL